MKKSSYLITILLICVFYSSCTRPGDKTIYVQSSTTDKPNIILIMGDDIGYSDLGSYGSEIETPELDKLAENGIRFRTFYNFAKCEVSRSSLLTGLYKGDERSINIASLLKLNGYETIHTGKEHFANWVPESVYAKNAFDHSFYFWAINEFHIPPDSTFENQFYHGHQKLETREIRVNETFFYKPDVVTDYAINFIDSALQKQKPFFLYIPYHVAHYPLQARPEEIDKYKGRYMIGWDSVREARYTRMIEMGLLSAKYQLTPPSDNINKFRGSPKSNPEIRKNIPIYRPWNSLSEKEKKDLDLEMAVYAAMIDRMDQNIGRLVQKLKKEGLFDNTIIMVLSDNGSCPYDSNKDFDIPPGPANSYRTLSAAWANVGNTPFKYFKQFGHEGGSNTFFIAHWPDKIESNQITDQPGHLLDIYPTLLEISGAKYPDSLGHNPTVSLHGSSLLPVFEGSSRNEPDFFISGFNENFRMYRSGEYKIVRANGEAWELYHVKEDPTEMKDLARDKPDILREMEQQYIKRKEEIEN